MSIQYNCKRCGFDTDNYCDLKRHINRKKMCHKNKEAICLSDDQILVKTLLPYIDGNHMINDNELLFLENSNVLHKNKINLLDTFDNVNKNKDKICHICNNEYKNHFELRKHLLLECMYKESCQTENNNQTVLNTITIQHTPILENGILNNGTLNNINNNNNFNIYMQYKTPIPFDEDWDVSHISAGNRSKLIVSNMMYKNLLEDILQNDSNLNVIIDKESKSGMVYKNEKDKYINMNQKDIIDSTMNKLNKHLINFNLIEKDDGMMKEVVNYTRQIINQNHINYCKHNEVQKEYSSVLTDVYKNKKKRCY